MAEEVILNGAQSYILDKTDVTNVLTGGGYHLAESIAHLTGFDTDWTVDVEEDAAAMRALRILYFTGGYAIWQALNENEEVDAYLVIYDDDGLVAKLTGNVLSKTTITEGQFFTKLGAYFVGTVLATEFTTRTQIGTAISSAASLVIAA